MVINVTKVYLFLVESVARAVGGKEPDRLLHSSLVVRWLLVLLICANHNQIDIQFKTTFRLKEEKYRLCSSDPFCQVFPEASFVWDIQRTEALLCFQCWRILQVLDFWYRHR